jgi:hypothetical protein
VVDEAIQVLTETLGVRSLDRVQEARMELAAPRRWHLTVHDFPYDRVLERVVLPRSRPHLVQELGRAQILEPLA